MISKMKTKKITNKEEYIAEFCRDLRLRKRKAIYVHPEIHERLECIANSLKEHHVSLSSLVTIILIRHTNTYWPILEKLIEEANATSAYKGGKTNAPKPANETKRKPA
jgi:hypothetical protein